MQKRRKVSELCDKFPNSALLPIFYKQRRKRRQLASRPLIPRNRTACSVCCFGPPTWPRGWSCTFCPSPFPSAPSFWKRSPHTAGNARHRAKCQTAAGARWKRKLQQSRRQRRKWSYHFRGIIKTRVRSSTLYVSLSLVHNKLQLIRMQQLNFVDDGSWQTRNQFVNIHFEGQRVAHRERNLHHLVLCKSSCFKTVSFSLCAAQWLYLKFYSTPQTSIINNSSFHAQTLQVRVNQASCVLLISLDSKGTDVCVTLCCWLTPLQHSSSDCF